MSKYEVVIMDYKEILELGVHEDSLSDNGCGKEDANYLVVKYNGGAAYFESDAMEPEDKSFRRELHWIKQYLEEAYEIGFNDGQDDMIIKIEKIQGKRIIDTSKTPMGTRVINDNFSREKKNKEETINTNKSIRGGE